MVRSKQRRNRKRKRPVEQTNPATSGEAARPKVSSHKRKKRKTLHSHKRKHESIVEVDSGDGPLKKSSRTAALQKLEKCPSNPPGLGRVYFLGTKTTNGVEHHVYKSDVGFNELVGWRNADGDVVDNYVQPSGQGKSMPAGARLCEQRLPADTPCHRDTGIPIDLQHLPGRGPWLLEDGTCLFPSVPGAITELLSYDDETVFLVMDAGSVEDGHGKEVPVHEYLDAAHRQTFPKEYKRLGMLGRLFNQTREKLLKAIKPSYDAAKKIGHRAVQSLLVVKPWHLGTWMKYARYAFTSADMEKPRAGKLSRAVEVVLEQINKQMKSIPHFANAYGSMRAVCDGVRRTPDIGRHGPKRNALTLEFVNQSHGQDDPIAMADLLGTPEWHAAAARCIVDEWSAAGSPLPAHVDALVDAILAHAELSEAAGSPTRSIESSRMRQAIRRGLQRHKPRLKPISSIHSTVAINSFQVDGNSIKYHFDGQDFEVEINCVVPHGNYTLGHLDLPEYKAAVEVRPGQVFFFHGRKTLHGTFKGAVRGMRNSINAFTVQNVAKASFDSKVDGRSRRTLQKLAQAAMVRSMVATKKTLLRRAIYKLIPKSSFKGDKVRKKKRPRAAAAAEPDEEDELDDDDGEGDAELEFVEEGDDDDDDDDEDDDDEEEDDEEDDEDDEEDDEDDNDDVDFIDQDSDDEEEGDGEDSDQDSV